MKRLSPLRRNFYYFRKIISKKHTTARLSLQAIELQVQVEYKKYIAACTTNSLSNFDVSIFNGVNHSNLKNCYANTIEVENLKKAIYDNQDRHVRYECQYCMIGDSSESFDHYLPKEAFPEFAVLSTNLIPCCTKCNSHKLTTWKDSTNKRNILNLYFDNIPPVQFLYCTVTLRGGTPIVSYNLRNPGGIDPALYSIIEKHFDRLHLIQRFKNKSGTEIVNTINSVRQFLGTYNRNQVSQFLLNDVREMKCDFGSNYWKAILKEALANSTPFLRHIGFI